MSVETKEIGEQIARRERQYESVVSVHHLRARFCGDSFDVVFAEFRLDSKITRTQVDADARGRDWAPLHTMNAAQSSG